MIRARPYGPYSDALELLKPVLDAERARGNTGTMHEGDIHDGRRSWHMRFPLDIPALEAQFVFGDGIAVSADKGGSLIFRINGTPEFGIFGGESDTARVRRRRAAWWAAWEAAPQPRVPVENPFPAVFS